MRNRQKLPNLYLALILVLMYLPILLVAIYSFNDGRLSSVWEGFSLRWYKVLLRDAAIFEALGNSLILSSAPWGRWGCTGFAAAPKGPSSIFPPCLL